MPPREIISYESLVAHIRKQSELGKYFTDRSIWFSDDKKDNKCLLLSYVHDRVSNLTHLPITSIRCGIRTADAVCAPTAIFSFEVDSKVEELVRRFLKLFDEEPYASTGKVPASRVLELIEE